MWTMLLLKVGPWLLRVAPWLSRLKGKGSLIVGAVSVLSILGTVLYITVLNHKIDDLTVSGDLVSYQLSQCQSVNGSNSVTISELRTANEDLARALTVSDEERVAAIKEAAERDAQAASALNYSLIELERLRNANPTCEQLSKIDIGTACPLVIDRLREHAAGTIGRD